MASKLKLKRQQNKSEPLSKRIKILGVLGLAIGGAILWRWSEVSPLFGSMLSLVQANFLYVLVVTAVVIIALIFLFLLSSTSARTRKRELDEYLRVAHQTQSDLPQTFKKDVVKPASDDKAPSIQKSDPSSATPKAKGRKQRVTHPKIASISDELYFQPVTEVSGGQIVGYEIFRQATYEGRQQPVFVQYLPGAKKADQADFEYATLQKVTLAAQYNMWADITRSSRINFFVSISDALLDDKLLWSQAESMLRKHSKWNPSVALGVNSSSFADAPKKVIGERLQKLKRLLTSDVPLVICGFRHDHNLIDRGQLRLFYLSSCEKSELLSCYAGEAEPPMELAFQQIQILGLETSVRGIVSESDVVDCMAAGAQYMSGDFLAPPRKLKANEAARPEADTQMN